MTTGSLINLVADDDALTSGKYLNFLGGTNHATTVFTVGEGGKTVISPTVASAAADTLTLTGTNQTTGNLVKLTIVDGTNTTGTYIKCTDESANVDFSVGEAGAVVVGGTLTANGASTLASLICTADGTFGGGYSGGSGATIATTGAISSNSTAQIDGVITSGITGSNGGIVVKSTGAGATTFSVTGATGNTVVGGTLNVTGVLTAPVLATEADTTATRVCTSADYGKIILLSYAGAVTVTLPANGAAAGSCIDFLIIGADTCAPTISAATADTLIVVGDAQADSVTFGSGHRIGAYVRFISTGTYWVAINVGSTTMTVATS
jgi:hypothetical protein